MRLSSAFAFARMDEYDIGFERRSYPQVVDAGDLEALRRLRATVIWLLSTMANKEAMYVGKEQ
jgi:hypothetical protein